MNDLPLNQVICGDCREVMKTFPDDCIDLVVTSPPYWGLRDYGPETVQVWGGLPNCDHEWGESLPVTSPSNTNIGFEKRSRENFRGGGHKPNAIAKKHRPSDAGKFCSQCGAWFGGLGLEPHPQMFIDHLVEICREIRRVLKPTGTFWCNLGDSYYGSHAGKIPQAKNPNVKIPEPPSGKADGNWLQPKQKLMMPSRVAIALQNDGWILRSDIIWHKPNHMPSSVKDRLTTAYEHVFLLVKARHYYFDLDSIRKPFSKGTFLRIRQPNIQNQPGGPKTLALRGESPDSGNASRPIDMAQELSRKIAEGKITGKNPGDVWSIPTHPFPAAHFATFPPTLIEPIIKAGSPRWICSKCGKPRVRITEPTPAYAKKLGKSVHNHKDDLKRGMRYDNVINAEYVTTGYTDCSCGEGWNPGVILDPFCGSGTALRVARRLGRRFIGIDIVPEYVEMSNRRIRAEKYSSPPEGVPSLVELFEAKK